jgi:heme a synthase
MQLASRLLAVRRLAIVCVVLTIVLMGLGAWVKANGAGLSCPDWPACYGQWLPPFPSSENGGTWDVDGDGVAEPVGYTQAEILYEWTHRFVVSILLLPLVAVAGLVLSRDVHPVVRTLYPVALGMYLLQAGLGAVTVVTGNPPWATSAHLVLATLFLTVLVAAATWAHLRPLPDPKPPAPEPPKPRVVSYVYPDTPDAPTEP